MWWFEWECPPQAQVFKYLVHNWYNCWGLGGVALLEQSVTAGLVFSFQKSLAIPVHSLCFLPVVWDMKSQLFPLMCLLPAAAIPWRAFLPPEAWAQITNFSPTGLGHGVSLQQWKRSEYKLPKSKFCLSLVTFCFKFQWHLIPCSFLPEANCRPLNSCDFADTTS